MAGSQVVTSKMASSAKKDSSKPANATGLLYNTPEQRNHLSHCDWRDKIMFAARLILGGNSINGFLRATATAQRIKKQRARQLALTKKTAAAAAAAATGTLPEPEDKSKENSKKGFDQSEEEKLKKEIMNPRTAKKIKAEMESGLQFCATLHNILRGVLFEVDPDQTPFLPAPLTPFETPVSPTTPAPPSHLKPSTSLSQLPRKLATPAVLTDPNMPWAVKAGAAAGIQQSNVPSAANARQSGLIQAPAISNKTTASPGGPGSSTLRKMRKKKLPPSNEPSVNLPEFDSSGKRTSTKKEHQYRLFEVLRFRPLKQGDYVAARLTSRDLWILARVLKDYPGFDMAPAEFLQLSDARRDAMFRTNVMVKDVEEKEHGGSAQVVRSLALPLPRTFSEAAEWTQR
jgi:hypothetical protein